MDDISLSIVRCRDTHARMVSAENSAQIGRNLINLNPSWMIDLRRHGRKGASPPEKCGNFHDAEET